MVLPFSIEKIKGVLKISKINSPQSKNISNIKQTYGDNANVTNTIVQVLPRTEEERQNGILIKLRELYILSHDNISPGLIAGLEELPKEWVEKKLEESGETWRRDKYI